MALNKWNKFRQKMGGKGYSADQITNMYNAKKYSTSSTPSPKRAPKKRGRPVKQVKNPNYLITRKKCSKVGGVKRKLNAMYN